MTAAVEVLASELFRLTEQAVRTPCQGRRRDRWTSDDAAERTWADPPARQRTRPHRLSHPRWVGQARA